MSGLFLDVRPWSRSAWTALRRPAFEFAHVTCFNALTLGAGLLVLGSMANISSRLIVIAGAHCESALLSYLYCSVLVWAQANDRLGRRVARAGMFFGLALVSAIASLLVSEAYKTGTRSLGFMLTNYGAVGAITIAKFVVQRWAMTTQRSFRGRSVRAQSDGIVPFSAPQKHA